MFNICPMFIAQFWDCCTLAHASSDSQTVCRFFLLSCSTSLLFQSSVSLRCPDDSFAVKSAGQQEHVDSAPEEGAGRKNSLGVEKSWLDTFRLH